MGKNENSDKRKRLSRSVLELNNGIVITAVVAAIVFHNIDFMATAWTDVCKTDTRHGLQKS